MPQSTDIIPSRDGLSPFIQAHVPGWQAFRWSSRQGDQIAETAVTSWPGMSEPGDGLEVDVRQVHDQDIIGVHLHLSVGLDAAPAVLRVVTWLAGLVSQQTGPGQMPEHVLAKLQAERGIVREGTLADRVARVRAAAGNSSKFPARPTEEAELLTALEKFSYADGDDGPSLSARVRRAVQYIAEIESEGCDLADLCQGAHDALDAAGISAKGTPKERIEALLARVSPIHGGQPVTVNLMGHQEWRDVIVTPSLTIPGAFDARTPPTSEVPGTWVGTWGVGSLHSLVPATPGGVWMSAAESQRRYSDWVKASSELDAARVVASRARINVMVPNVTDDDDEGMFGERPRPLPDILGEIVGDLANTRETLRRAKSAVDGVTGAPHLGLVDGIELLIARLTVTPSPSESTEVPRG